MSNASEIKNKFNDLLRRASENGPELRYHDIWEEVQTAFITENFNDLEKDELFNIILRFAQLFIDKDCQHKGLITHVLSLASQDRVQHYHFFTRNYIMERFHSIISIRSHKSCDFGEIFSVPYKEAQVFDGIGDSVARSAVAGDIDQLQLLLKFGATMIQPPEGNSKWKYYEIVLNDLFSYVPATHIEASLSSDFNQASKRRLYFVVLCLEVLIRLKSETSGAYHYIASLRLLFKAIPEPLVTTKEILRCFEKLLRGLQKKEQIQTVVSEFGNFFPESLQIPGPRSLKHLGRFQVRENLRTSAFAFRLPQAVESLPLPIRVKNYILFTDENLKISFDYTNLC